MTCKNGPKPCLKRADLALAYELREAGCYWKVIAYGLGVEADALRKSVNKAMREGLE